MTDAPAFLTTKEVAELLRVKERKVYDLAAADEIPFRRVTGRLLFPRGEIEAWLAAGSDPRAAAASAAVASPRRPNIVVGSHDPLLEDALRASGSGVASLFDGSLDGLDRLAAGEAAACALHVPNDDLSEWNLDAAARRLEEDAFVMIEWARRRQGLLLPAGADDAPRSIDALGGRRVVRRQASAGSHLLLNRLLRAASVAPEDVEWIAPPARTEAEAAQLVARGKADAALGLEAMAALFGLDFVPLIEERFDLIVERRAFFEPPFQRLFDYARGPELRRRAAEIPGYDVSRLGRVIWNGV